MVPYRLSLALVLGTVLLAGLTARAHAPAGSTLGRPTAAVWPGTQRWTDELEREYGDFVARLGEAVEARRCGRLDACLADPAANATFDPAVDVGLHLAVDCADLPYILRAYFSFKKDLPFGYVSLVTGEGFDIRWAVRVTPRQWRSWRDAPTPVALLEQLGDIVHTGMYRIPAEQERGDFYPVRVDRDAVAPGTLFYDPLGHVSVVARVEDDGDVYFLNGVPDGSLTWTRLDSGYSIGASNLGGGFKRFRPISRAGHRLERARNRVLADFDPLGQYDLLARFRDETPIRFHEWVRASLIRPGGEIDPVDALRERVRGLCREVTDRAAAVELARRDGLPSRRLRALPADIYRARGEWEIYATAARDARLRARFSELTEGVRATSVWTRPALRAAWEEEIAGPSCGFTYLDSAGGEVAFTLETVLHRLFALSFDPYHCPERRWGAPEGSLELQTCTDDAARKARYDEEAPRRTRIDRAPGRVHQGEGATPLDVDLRALFPRWDFEL